MSARRILLVLLGLTEWAGAQQYPFVQTKGPNAPVNVRTLMQDHLGRIWDGTLTGVDCFDGNRFLICESMGCRKAVVGSLAEDDGGGIWIATEQGLYYFASGRVTRVKEGFVVNVIRAGPGVMLAVLGPKDQRDRGLKEFWRVAKVAGAWKAEAMPIPKAAFTFSKSSKGEIAYGNLQAWYEIALSEIVHWRAGMPIRLTEHALPPETEVLQVLRDRNGCAWFRNQHFTSYQCEGDKETHPIADSLSERYAMMREANDGTIILPNLDRLMVGRPETFKVAKTANGLPTMNDVLVAADGSLWLACLSGLVRFSHPFEFEYWNQRDGLGSVFSTLRMGRKVFAGDTGGVKELSPDRGHWSVLPRLPNLGLAMHMIPGPANTIYVARHDQGLEQIRFDGTPVRKTPKGLGALHLAQTRDKRLWVSAFGVSLVEFHNGRITYRDSTLPGNRAAAPDIETNPSNGDLWACHEGDLIKKIPSGWQHFTKKDGLLDGSCFSLAVNGDGDVWYGYSNPEAITLFRPRLNAAPDVQHFRASQEIQDLPAMFLDFDKRGWLWRGGVQGVYVADPAGAKRSVWLRLAENDGLDAVYTNQQSFYQDPDGSVWFSADHSLMHFSPPADLLAPRVASVFVSGLSWDGGSPHLIDATREAPSGADVTAHIGSLEFRRRNALQFRYRLLPGKSAWKEEKNFDLKLGKLAWGEHTLEVQGRELKGPWSSTTAQRFTVKRPIWATWPFALSVVLFGIGTSAAAAKGHRKRITRERKALPDMGQWRLAALIPEGQQFIGTTIDKRFKVLRMVARGGFGTVLEAIDLANGQRCAVKVFRNELADEWRTKRFLQEIAALETIEHPNVVRILAHGTADSDTPYLAMEFVEGTTLRVLIEKGRLEGARVASLLRQAGSALGALHQREFIIETLRRITLWCANLAGRIGILCWSIFRLPL